MALIMEEHSLSFHRNKEMESLTKYIPIKCEDSLFIFKIETVKCYKIWDSEKGEFFKNEYISFKIKYFHKNIIELILNKKGKEKETKEIKNSFYSSDFYLTFIPTGFVFKEQLFDSIGSILDNLSEIKTFDYFNQEIFCKNKKQAITRLYLK